MHIGIFGTGIVGTTIGTKLLQLGHAVKLGSRTPDNVKASEWAAKGGPNASHGTFADAAAFGEIVFNCTQGLASLEVLRLAGPPALKGKILIDIANPLDFSKGFPPSLAVCNTDSLGEQIQRALPDTHVVKTLNTVNCHVMVNPARIPGDHDIFLCWNNADAKARVTEILRNGFGWKSVIDLGDITGARAMEMLLPVWVRLYNLWKTPDVGFQIAHPTLPA